MKYSILVMATAISLYADGLIDITHDGYIRLGHQINDDGSKQSDTAIGGKLHIEGEAYAFF